MRKLKTSTVASVVFTAAVAVIAVASGDGGFKEAIRELYAKIRSLETSGVGAIYLDDATSIKAMFVIDGLRQMVGRDRATINAAKRDRALAAKASAVADYAPGRGEQRPQRYGKETSYAVNDGGTGRPDDGVQKIIDRFKNEMSLATDQATIVAQRDVKAAALSSSLSPNREPDVNVEELEQKFLAVLQQYDTQKKTTAFHSTSMGHEPIRGHECKARSPARQNRIFQQLFNRKRIPSGLSASIFY